MNPNQEKLNFLCDFDENNANPVELERFKNYVNSSQITCPEDLFFLNHMPTVYFKYGCYHEKIYHFLQLSDAKIPLQSLRSGINNIAFSINQSKNKREEILYAIGEFLYQKLLQNSVYKQLESQFLKMTMIAKKFFPSYIDMDFIIEKLSQQNHVNPENFFNNLQCFLSFSELPQNESPEIRKIAKICQNKLSEVELIKNESQLRTFLVIFKEFLDNFMTKINNTSALWLKIFLQIENFFPILTKMAKRLKVSSYLVSWFQCLTKLKYFEIANRFILFILDKPVKLSYFYSIMENEQEWINYFINERIIPFPESIPDSFFTKKERIILFNKIVENAEDREEMNNYLKSIDYVIAVKQGFNNEDVRESTLNVIQKFYSEIDFNQYKNLILYTYE